MAEKNLEQMKEAVAEIREKMAAAAREAGRDPAAVQLCAACKTRTAQTVAASAALPILGVKPCRWFQWDINGTLSKNRVIRISHNLVGFILLMSLQS